MRWLPGLKTLRRSEPSWLRQDLVAGLVMTTMLVPVGIAYRRHRGYRASMASTRPSCRYSPTRCSVPAASSFSARLGLAAVILAVVLPLSASNPKRAVAMDGMMAIVSGVVCVAAGLARLGFITELLSKPIRYGYMNGIALTVMLSQIPKLFGFGLRQWTDPAGVGHRRKGDCRKHEPRVTRGRRQHSRADTGPQAPASRTGNPDRRDRCQVAVAVFDLAARSGISVLGLLPRGLPTPRLPIERRRQPRADPHGRHSGRPRFIRRYQRALSNPMRRAGTAVDPNQEMVGLGVANLAAGALRAFHQQRRFAHAGSRGGRRQNPADRGRGCARIALLLMVAPDLLQDLPHTALAAVVIASAIGLFEVSDLRRIYRIQRWEFWLSMACFAGVATLGAIPGIALAIVIAVIEFLWDGWRPHSAVLGRVERVKGYHDITRYPEARLIPGLVLFRWDAPLFFANAELFHERVLDAVASSPTPVRWLVVAAEPVTSVDVTAADAVCELDDTLHTAGIELCFAEMKDPVKDKLKRFGLFERFGKKTFFATLGEAVNAYLASRSVEWIDWEERTPGSD